MKKKMNASLVFFVLVLICSVIGVVYSILSYSTGYYVMGEMNSTALMAAACGAIVLEVANVILMRKLKSEWITTILQCLISGALIVSFAVLIGDRVEGIGFTIVTQFDAGHGGAEACYLSFVACGAFLLGSILTIMKSFLRTNEEKVK